MDKRIDSTVNDYIALVNKNYRNVIRAILFGSFAKDLQNKYSDIDIALVFNILPEDERFDMMVQLMLLASEIDSRIEPHPFSSGDFNSDSPIINEIKTTGIEIDINNTNQVKRY
jgi:predicted nucleotidyltransferase